MSENLDPRHLADRLLQGFSVLLRAIGEATASAEPGPSTPPSTAPPAPATILCECGKNLQVKRVKLGTLRYRCTSDACRSHPDGPKCYTVTVADAGRRTD